MLPIISLTSCSLINLALFTTTNCTFWWKHYSSIFCYYNSWDFTLSVFFLHFKQYHILVYKFITIIGILFKVSTMLPIISLTSRSLINLVFFTTTNCTFWSKHYSSVFCYYNSWDFTLSVFFLHFKQ